MNDIDETTRPETTSAAAPVAETAEAVPARKRGLRQRVFDIRAVAAVALASLVLGGIGGTALGVAASPDDDGRPGQLDGPGPMGGPGQLGGPGRPGQVQPTTPPEDPDSGTSSGTSSGTTMGSAT